MNALTRFTVAILAVALMSGCAAIDKIANRIETNKLEKIMVQAAVTELGYRVAKDYPHEVDKILVYCNGIVNGEDNVNYTSALQEMYHELIIRFAGMSPGVQIICQGYLDTIIADLGASVADGGLVFDDLDVARLKWLTQQFAMGMQIYKEKQNA